VKNQPVVGLSLKFCGHKPLKALLDFTNGFSMGEPSTIRDPKDMGIDGNRFPSKCGVENHIGGLAADTGQGLECVTIFWNLSLMVANQNLTGCNEMLSFCAEKTNRSDIRLNPSDSEAAEALWGVGDSKELACCSIHRNIGRLC
jgi:hypothetical protein